MSDLRKAAEIALEALHNIDQSNNYDAIEALRQALAQPEQEPVAWMDKDSGVVGRLHQWKNAIPLYTAPPKREWRGLGVVDFNDFNPLCTPEQAARWAEEKLKEKNT